MITACPQCTRRFQVDPSALGKEVHCPSCGTPFNVVPAPNQVQAQSAQPAAAPTAPQPQAAAPVPRVAAQHYSRPAGLRLNGLPLPAALLVGIGLLLVVAARGSDAIGARGVARAAAKQQEKMRASGNSGNPKTPSFDSDDDPRMAASDNMAYGYWREWMFLVGTLSLTAGLLWTGFATSGAIRWFSFGGLGIIVFSMYIGGMAWVGSIANVIAGVIQRF
jgi:predicted Zn finger-like uncharacterized protein